MINVKQTFLLSLFSLTIGVLFLWPASTEAATLLLSPSVGKFDLSRTVSVNIMVTSADRAVNAYEGKVVFPTNLLEAISVSKNGSIVGLWVEEPSFSNSTGEVSFSGITLNPGFTGTDARLLRIDFKPKHLGTAKLNIQGGSVLANDGNGSNVLTNVGGANLTIVSDDESSLVEVVKSSKISLKITSETHPDQNKWYSNADAIFSWKLPPVTKTVRMLLDKKAFTIPAFGYEPTEREEISNIDQGVSYFHLRIQTGSGWGNTEHYKVQIDTVPPSIFEVREVPRTDLTIRKVQFVFDTADETSGVDHYEITIDGGETDIMPQSKGNIYETGELPAGRHTLYARAVDQAGNYLDKKIDFVIKQPIVFTIGKWAFSILAIIIPLLLILFLLVILAVYLYSRFRIFKRKVYREAEEAEEMLKKSFSLLKEDVGSGVTGKELAEELTDAEKAIKKEIKDISKVVGSKKKDSETS